MLPMQKMPQPKTEVLVSARMMGVVPAHHRLANRKVLHPEDFEGERFVALEPIMEVRTRIDALMLSHGVNRRVNVETQLSSATIKLVEAGAGLAIIEPLTASAYTGGLLSSSALSPRSSLTTQWSFPLACCFAPDPSFSSRSSITLDEKSAGWYRQP